MTSQDLVSELEAQQPDVPFENELMVDIKNLTKYYGDTKAVDGIDLQIPKKAIFGFLGPNGAGKTTTINTLITLLKPTGGTGIVAGYDLKDAGKIRTKVSAVFQEQTLDETLTGLQNLRLHSDLYRIPKAIREKRIAELVKMVGLEDRVKDKVIKYSGGMRRRLEIARGLITRPEILFLDEPTTGLDPQSRQKIWDKILELRNRDDITIFITTHAMEEAEALCDEIAIIDLGKIIVKGTPEQLKASLGKDMIVVEITNKNDLEEAEKRVKSLTYVENTRIQGTRLIINLKESNRYLAQIVQAIAGTGDKFIQISNIEAKKPSLNDVFMYYTGKTLRDDDADLSDRLKMSGRKARSFMGRRR